MITIYASTALVFIVLLGIWYLVTKTESILSRTPLRVYEYEKIYLLVKREFNIGNSKTWTHDDVIDKCQTVNREWNEDPTNTKCDIFVWTLMAAYIYINNSHCRKAPVKRKLYKYKWKYHLEYFFIKTIAKIK